MEKVSHKLNIEVRHDGRYFWMECPELGRVFSSAENYQDALNGFYGILVERAKSLVMNLYYGWRISDEDVKYVRFVFENRPRLKDLFAPVYAFGFSKN